MNWWLVVALLIAIYAAVALVVYTKKLFSDYITFYGPIMAIKSQKTAFFNWFTRMSTMLRIYGSIGVIVVVVVSVLITLLLFFALQYTLVLQPEPTGIYEPRNILLLPGINQYVPSTFAVWFALYSLLQSTNSGTVYCAGWNRSKSGGSGYSLPSFPSDFSWNPMKRNSTNRKGCRK